MRWSEAPRPQKSWRRAGWTSEPEEALNTLKDGLSHLSPEEVKKQAKAFEKFAEEKAHEFAEKPLHEKLGDAAETLGDGAINILGSKGMGMLGTVGAGASDVARTAEELEKAVKAEQKVAKARRGTVKAVKAEAEHLDREAAERLARDAREREVKHAPPQSKPTEGAEPRNRAAFERYKDELRKDMEAPHVHDPELVDTIKNLYREGATEGSGSTAAAVRQELQTGEATKGRFHSEKATNRIWQLETWLKNNPDARPGDRAAAENLLRDMRNALKGMPKE